MAQHPIDLIAQAIRTADGQHTMGAAALAEVVAENVTHPEVITNAVNALLHDGWRETYDGGLLSDEDLTNIARTVLASLSEAFDRPSDD